MKYLLTLTICLSILTIACQDEIKTPVKSDTLVRVLTDMHIAEAAAEGEFTTIKDSLLKIYYGQILAKHGVSQADFDTTLALYSRQPVVFDSLYAEVLREVVKIDTTKH